MIAGVLTFVAGVALVIAGATVLPPPGLWVEPLPDEPASARTEQTPEPGCMSGANHWLRIDVPGHYAGRAETFLVDYGLAAPPGSRGEVTNWWRPMGGSCKPDEARPIDGAMLPNSFWFFAGRTPPDTFASGAHALLPQECDRRLDNCNAR